MLTPSHLRTLLISSVLIVGMLLSGCSNHTPDSVDSPIGQRSQVQQSQVFSPLAHDILFRALGLVGVPYRWGGNTPDSGFDCSGLIAYVYRETTGIRLPRTTTEMSQMHGPNVARGSLLAGDLVFFATNGPGRVSHAGIYVGEGRFIHAPSAGGTVRMDQLSSTYWQKNYLGAKRILSNQHLAVNP
ncbi:NlpC/P60 family protein [Azomonas agilis]|uniref:NlpC/P60 family protein n=1 Tax=Azomonas agilis TaxID=116849 RepID=A0A562J2I4_9GAMM|nr:C40 family peptidase [Azomonas agilis]TWH77333.1 NlpC/P60 family protein [Azomonas agilis]